MKLSEAILRGCESGPKAKGDLRDRDGGLCAFGAALVAETGSAKWGARCGCGHIGDDCPEGLCPVDSFTDNLGWLRIETKVTHPVTGLPDTLGYVVIDLNNNHDWSREAIAMWVETVEKAMEAEKPEPAAEVKAEVPTKCTV